MTQGLWKGRKLYVGLKRVRPRRPWALKKFSSSCFFFSVTLDGYFFLTKKKLLEPK